MKAGFIGTGSMGSILIEALIHSGALNPEQICAANRTPGKVKRLAETYAGLVAASDNPEVAGGSDVLFLCVKPFDYKRVIDEIRPVLKPSQILVSITSSVLLRHLESQLPCKVTKVIPSITNYVLTGSSLCIHGERMHPEDKEWIENLLTHISTPVRVSEAHTRISSDLSSCGPAFLAFFLQKYVDAAVQETGISREEANILAAEMTLGTGKLLTTGGFDPVTLQKRVCVPGGITAEGLRLMDHDLDGMFNRLIQITHAKYEEDLEKVESVFATKR
ncbi:late competence protein ComER [Paenibacillus lutrae]|uniref:Pyrroline-5-carboxylate reductase n=1 Tax=Paenibacillus lutrae TaxID=2078573 RepID=A0A7X3FGS5_9BACL|nr:late competence protein ComER [Paenibacillus lutrae]MVO99490.1 late competence protein ComER [Paenibacillus lutrae]